MEHEILCPIFSTLQNFHKVTTDILIRSTGVPLIAVNPFQNVADLYDSATVEKYKRIGPSEIKVKDPTLCHICGAT